jgi:SNF2 family DNA or RNA helicase
LDKGPLPEIDIAIEVDSKAFKTAFSDGTFTSPERYELALEGQRIRFRETFENLISLHSLRDVRSLWYQEETARKILKSFRGRALLADEVGLGKTIEALMVLKEYLQRGMVKSVLILTPAPLVSQWKGELRAKFGLQFSSTNDPEYRSMESSFWKRPFILASIAIAKSKKNFPVVTEREYDLVIVDEAHHLKNRNTLNWKLVNALKKRFLLLHHENEIRAITNLCRSLDEISKNLTLLDIIKGLPDKKIIFVKYLGTLDHVSEFLTRHDIPHALFHGGLDNRMKEGQIERFREEKDVLLTTELGGEGRNLQFCHHMINYDLPWNPMKIEQRIGRLHRIGQENEVTIYNLCAAGSIEDYILQVLDKKINMFEMVIGEIDMILGRIGSQHEFSDTVYDIWIDSGSKEDRKRAFNKLGSRLQRAKTSYQKTKELDERLFGEHYEL